MLAKANPSLKINLRQAGLELHPRDYCSIAIFSTLFYFILVAPLVFLTGLIITNELTFVLPLSAGGVFSFFVFFYILNYPKLIASRRMKQLERDLLNAMHHMLIEIKSGVPLFNAMVGVSDGYGEVSEEFSKIVRDVNGGVSEAKALEASSQRNPSLYFRRAIWQIINAIRAGSDLANAIDALVESLVNDQIIAVRRYSQELSPYTMMYMLAAVILPSLGITFLIIISSFSGISVPKLIYPLIVVGLALFQFFYMGLIKTKRPVMDV